MADITKANEKISAWDANMKRLKAGVLGNVADPKTLLRYWEAQEAAGYPGANENVRYFKELIKREPCAREWDTVAGVLLHIKEYLHAILNEWYRRQEEPHFYELNIRVYNHIRKELDDLYAFAEKLGVKLDEDEGEPLA